MYCNDSESCYNNAMNNRRTFFSYVIPSVLSFALSGIYAIVDGFFIGNRIGDVGLSTINIAYPITAFIQAAGTGIGIGASVRYSILMAGGDKDRASEFIAGAIYMMLLISAVISGGVFFFSRALLAALGASDQLLSLGNEYIRLIAVGSLLQVFGTGLVPFMRNFGGSLWAMGAMIGGFITNVFLDFFLIWIKGKGMTGAALATVAGQGITMLVALIYCLAKRRLALRISSYDIWDVFLRTLKIGLAPFALTLAPNISLIIINRFSVFYGGEAAIAIYACISYIIWIVYLLLQGVGDGSQPLMSRFFGEGDKRSLSQIKSLAYESAILLAIAGALVIFFLRARIGLLFGSSATVNKGIIRVMPIFLLSLPFDAITRVTTALFYATEKSIRSYILTFSEPVILLLLILFLPPLAGGQTMIWWSAVIAKVVTAGISIWLGIRGEE